MNAKLLTAAKATNNNILLLSATIVDKPTDFAIFAYVLGLSTSIKVLVEWIRDYKHLQKLYTLYCIQKINPKLLELRYLN